MVLLKTFTATLANVLRRTAAAAPARTLHQSAPLFKVEDRKAMLASLPGKDEGTIGERSIDIDSMILKKHRFFPDAETPTTLFGGCPSTRFPSAISGIRQTTRSSQFATPRALRSLSGRAESRALRTPGRERTLRRRRRPSVFARKRSSAATRRSG
uniref:(northern house mosquito) hypothetical protein n=1 Tax=Culex pipiens TaxID=7175 RepID=A0A8D8CSG3_CULPI